MYEINCTIVYSQINEAFFFIYGTKIAPFKFCIYWNIFEQWKQLKNNESNQTCQIDFIFYALQCLIWFIVFNATFSNISAISWQPVLE